MSSDQSVVWILGAGFSRSLGAPLLGVMLTSEALKKVQITYPEFVAPHAEIFGNIIYNYKQGAYGASHFTPTERHWAHAEEFLERLDLAAEDETTANLLLASWHNNQLRHVTSPQSWATMMRTMALWLMAAECCVFLERQDLRSERWQPYIRWTTMLQPQDYVLTFNYDRVPDLLEKRTNRLVVLTPREVAENEPFGKARVLKLHGSVDWIRDGVSLGHVPPGHKLGSLANTAAMYTDNPNEGIATPVLSLTLFHRSPTTLYRESSAVKSLTARTSPDSRSGDGKRSAGALDARREYPGAGHEQSYQATS